MKRRLSVTCAIGALIGLAGVACDERAPEQPTPTPTNPTVTVTTVTVSGTAVFDRPGDAAQFAAMATFSNGTTQNVTGDTTWQSADSGVAAVSQTGLVSAVAAGDVDIRASYRMVTGTLRVRVNQPGPGAPQTFTLCGSIQDDTPENLPVRGAVVQIREGVNSGRGIESDDAGKYCLASLQGGAFKITISKTGYEPIDVNVTLAENRTLSHRLRRLYSLCGSVTAPPSNAPVPGASVQVVDGGATGRATETDAAGKYCFTDMPGGAFRVRASKSGYASGESSGVLTADVTLNIVLGAQNSLCGTVTDAQATAPLSGARVQVLGGVNAGRAVDTTAAGAYCIDGLQPDTFTARASKSGYDSLDRQVSLTASQTLDFALRPAVVSTPTITIGANGVVRPSQITISVGQQVLFVNSHTAAHDVESDPHPGHTQCPAINIGLLAPGQSRLLCGQATSAA